MADDFKSIQDLLKQTQQEAMERKSAFEGVDNLEAEANALDPEEFKRQLDLFLKRAHANRAARKAANKHFRRGIYAVRPIHWFFLAVTCFALGIGIPYASITLNSLYRVGKLTAQGEAQAMGGDVEGASLLMERALSYGLNKAEVYLRFANAFYLGGDNERALAAVDRHLELLPASTDGKILKASIFFDEGKNAQAAVLLSEVLLASGWDRRALILAGRLEMRQLNYHQAVDNFKTVLQLWPRDVEAHHYLRQIYLAEGNYEAALAEQNVLLTLDVSELENVDVPVLVSIAQLFIEAGRQREAQLILDKLVQSNIADPEVFYNLALLTLAADDPAGAVEYLQKALAMRPSFPNALVLMGEIAYMQGDLAGAIESFQTALRIDPVHPRANYDMGNIFYFDYNDYGVALRHFLTAKSRDFSSPYLNYNIGYCHYKRGDFLEAFLVWQEVPEAFRNSTTYQWATGNVLLLTGDPGAALSRYLTVYAAEGAHNPSLLNNIGVANELLGNPVTAQDYYWKAVRESADQPADADPTAQNNIRRSLEAGQLPVDLEEAMHMEIEKQLEL